MKAMPITGVTADKTIAHGGDLGSIRRRYPDAPHPWIDLSTGINPVPYPVADPSADRWSRLPSREDELELLEAASARYGCPTGTIVAAPGTQILIQLLPRLAARSRVAIVGTTYAEHEHCWRRCGHEVAVVPHLADAAGADVIVVVNPDNPTGRLIEPQALRATDTRLLVVDEAFIDLAPAEASLARDLPDNAIVLRSFGKTYGLAGLRLGFAIAKDSIAARLREELGPWAVSGPALAIGATALKDDGWLRQTAARLTADSKRLDALLAATGFTVLGGTTLFRLASHPEAVSLVDRLARQAIHVRAFAHQPSWLRFGLPADDEGFTRLSATLQVPQKVR
jgi:cobalamin biosynthesis protein CobC